MSDDGCCYGCNNNYSFFKILTLLFRSFLSVTFKDCQFDFALLQVTLYQERQRLSHYNSHKTTLSFFKLRT
jgi:hypothetical protein